MTGEDTEVVDDEDDVDGGRDEVADEAVDEARTCKTNGQSAKAPRRNTNATPPTAIEMEPLPTFFEFDEHLYASLTMLR